MTRIRYTGKENQNFQTTVKQRVDAYFADGQRSSKASAMMVLKSICYLSAVTGLYLLLLFGKHSNLFFTILLFVLLGLSMALVGINVCHDAIHGAYSRHKWINKLMSMPFNIVGASAYMWNIMHNIVHHTHTNVEGYDEDIELVSILRLSPHQPYKKMMRYQHIYAFFLYSLSTLSWVFIKDYRKFFQSRIGHYDNSSHRKREYFFLFFYKFLYYFLFIALPFFCINLPWWQILSGLLILHLAEGLTLAVIFVLAHIVEGPEFPQPDDSGVISHNWAEHQLLTTSNFCRHNKFVSFLCGGLNFQVEHHLFPRICHVHYPAISDIVKSSAEEFNIPYNEQPAFWGALASHVRILKKLGQQP